MIKKQLTNILLMFIIGIFALTACGGSNAETTPTLDPNMIQTQAIETFSAALTQTALAAPSDTPVPTLTPAPTLPPLSVLPTSTAGTPFGGATVAATTSCYRLTFVGDVSILDNTPMAPGQTFTKTWKVKNSWTCAWDAGFKFAFTGGNAMNGLTYALPSSVAAEAVVDISVAMTAPSTAGSARGNWRMSTAGGQFFGDEVYVVIVVGGATLTATTGAATNTSVPATATSSSTPTSTPTTAAP